MLLLVETCPFFPVAPPPPVADVSVAVDSVFLATGSQTQAIATVTDASGNVLADRSVSWASDNPSVASVLPSSPTTALVSAVAAGSATITASSEGKSGGSTVTVPSTTADSVASVTVTADSTSLLVGATTRVSATLKDASGTVLTDRSVTWSSSNALVATVLATGPTTAEVTAIALGTATITATGEGKSGGVSITVSTQTSGGTSNEPSGFTLATQRSFNAKVENGWTATTSSGFSITSDATALKSPSSVGQMLFPAGASSYDPGWTEFNISGLGYTKIYVSFWLKVSSNWQGHPIVNKVHYIWMHGMPVFVAVIIGTDGGPLHSEARTQDTPIGSRNLPPNLASVEIVRGKWQRWELVLVSNTGGNADGQIHWWIDGTKVGEYSDVIFASSSEGKNWQVLSWRPIWGGAGGVVVEDMYMWMDHYYASGQ